MPEENWITVRDTHEAVVNEETFWNVQKLLSIKRPANVRSFDNVFVGKVKCPDCGKNMGYQGLQGRHTQGNFVCNRYRRNPKSCTAHYIKYNTLYNLVLQDIRNKAAICREYRGDFTEYLRQLLSEISDVQEANCKKELEKAKVRNDELDTIIKRLFEQNALGVIPDDRFATLFGEYTAEQKGLNAKIDTMKAQLDSQNSDAKNAEMFFELIQKYTDIETLTTQIIADLIDHIVVHEHDPTNE